MYANKAPNLMMIKRQNMMRRVLAALTPPATPVPPLSVEAPATAAAGAFAAAAAAAASPADSSAGAPPALPVHLMSDAERAERTKFLASLSGLPPAQQLQALVADALQPSSGGGGSGSGGRWLSHVLHVIEWCHHSLHVEQRRIARARQQWAEAEAARRAARRTDPQLLADKQARAAAHVQELVRRAEAERLTAQYEAAQAARRQRKRELRIAQLTEQHAREQKVYVNVWHALKTLAEENPDQRYPLQQNRAGGRKGSGAKSELRRYLSHSLVYFLFVP
jgi:hypothetical protein